MVVALAGIAAVWAGVAWMALHAHATLVWLVSLFAWIEAASPWIAIAMGAFLVVMAPLAIYDGMHGGKWGLLVPPEDDE
jgi:hypothetical protein